MRECKHHRQVINKAFRSAESGTSIMKWKHSIERKIGQPLTEEGDLSIKGGEIIYV